MTLQEITFIGSSTYTPVDLRATIKKLYSDAFGGLRWVAQRSLSDGAGAERVNRFSMR